MAKFCVHYWLDDSDPDSEKLVAQARTTALLCDVECRLSQFGRFTSLYIITDDEELVGTLSSFGTPAYAGRI